MTQETRGEKNIRWISTFCVYPDGPKCGQSVVLTPHQRQWIKSIYDTPTRRFILSLPRKQAKTAFTSFLLLLHLCGPEAKRNSQLVSAAQSREQAGLLFGYAAKCVQLSSVLSTVVKVKTSAKVLECPQLGTSYKALSAEAATALGLNPTFVVHDELGQVRGSHSELYENIETATGAQADPLTIIISTQAAKDSDLLSILIDNALNNPSGKTKCILYSAPLELDPFSEDAIKVSNPHYDHFMNKSEVLQMAQDAKNMPSKEASYRNLILNQRVEAKSPFVNGSTWEKNSGFDYVEEDIFEHEESDNDLPLNVTCSGMEAEGAMLNRSVTKRTVKRTVVKVDPDFVKPDWRGKQLWGGLDLSAVNDLTALVLTDADGNVYPWFWLPEQGINEKSRIEGEPYDQWAKNGDLELTPGPTIDKAFVAHLLKEIFDSADIQQIAFDRWGFEHLKNHLINAGFTEHELDKFVSFGQGFRDMSPAINVLEEALLKGDLSHFNHPVLTMCARNTITTADPAGNRKFVKSNQKGRIDGMVALAMSLSVRSTGTQNAEPLGYPFFIF